MLDLFDTGFRVNENYFVSLNVQTSILICLLLCIGLENIIVEYDQLRIYNYVCVGKGKKRGKTEKNMFISCEI